MRFSNLLAVSLLFVFGIAAAGQRGGKPASNVAVFRNVKPTRPKSRGESKPVPPLSQSEIASIVANAGLTPGRARGGRNQGRPGASSGTSGVWTITPRHPYTPNTSFETVGCTWMPIANTITLLNRQNSTVQVNHMAQANVPFVVDFSVANSQDHSLNVTVRIGASQTAFQILSTSNGHIMAVMQPSQSGWFAVFIDQSQNPVPFDVTQVVVSNVR
ncbi:MAG TPA: hypothetical protein VKT78_12795 [Fimbriimonadaceae bacterium]|nr:hypothetical protein [Fimbriimonadaceae bacterium]